MPEWFDVAKDDQGTISLKVPPSTEHYVAGPKCEGAIARA